MHGQFSIIGEGTCPGYPLSLRLCLCGWYPIINVFHVLRGWSTYLFHPIRELVRLSIL